MNKFILLFTSVCASLALLIFFISYQRVITEKNQFPDFLEAPLGLPPIPWPENNLYTREKAYLGKLLYFDKRLSSDKTISCATCHTLNDAFTDLKQLPSGIEGRQGVRNTPTIINSAYLKHLFWDGRASSLEEQAKGPIGNPNEMTLLDNVHEAHRACESRIQAIAGYRLLFKKAFGNESCSLEQVAQALATFERTVLSGNSPFDKYLAGDKNALNAEQINGWHVFKKVGCANCHSGPQFSDGRFLNIGVGLDQDNPDLGRYLITHNENDWGAFKIPTLREVENTFPYMHNGQFWTLEEVVEYYNKGGNPNHNLHPLMKPLNLSEQDKKALVSFLKSLNGEGWQHFTEPLTFP